jgi:hypothetical protein
MKYKKKRYYERRPFKLKKGGGNYRLSGDMRYRSAMPSLSDILNLASTQSHEAKELKDVSYIDMIKARLPMFKVISRR